MPPVIRSGVGPSSRPSTSSSHGPAAFTVTEADARCVPPATRSVISTPTTRSPSVSSRSTLAWLSTTAPASRAASATSTDSRSAYSIWPS